MRFDPLRVWRFGHLGLFYLFLYGPILVLVALSFNRSGLPTAWSGFSTEWYGALLENGKILRSLANSLIVAAAATAIALLLGTALALALEEKRASPALEALIAAPMIVPDIVLAIGLLSLYSLLGMTLGLHSIILSHSVFDLAFATAIVRQRLRHFDRSILEASIDLGAGEWTTFRRVTLPLIAPGLVAAGLLSFTLSFDEFIIAYFTAAPGEGSTTFPMQIYAMIRFGVTPEINALSSLVMGFSFFLILMAQRFDRKAVDWRAPA